MDYIETRPPISETDIEEYIESLKSGNTRVIDGIILSNLVRVCYECALKKGELIDLSIGDVAKGGIVRDVMSVSGKPISLSAQAKQVLQNHIDYIKDSGYRLYPASPLFPTKSRGRYNPRLLQNHIKNIIIKMSKPDDTTIFDFSFEKVRQSGICRHYDQMREKKLSPRECLKKSKRFARVSERETKNLLGSEIQSTGKKVKPFSKYLEEIEYAVARSKRKEIHPETRNFDEIRNAVKKDSALNKEEKKALEKCLDKSIIEAQEDTTAPEKIDDGKNMNSLRDAIKNYSEPFESESVDDIIEYFELDKGPKP